VKKIETRFGGGKGRNEKHLLGKRGNFLQQLFNVGKNRQASLEGRRGKDELYREEDNARKNAS